MCAPALVAPLLAAAGTTGAAAAGTGFSLASALSLAGTAATVGGALYQGAQTAGMARYNAELVEQQSATERALNVVEDERTRARMRQAIAQQRADFAARGVSLDSPTAVLLGRRAAEELSVASQTVRSTGQARQTELGAERRSYLARARGALMEGRLSAAGSALTAIPKRWPGLGDRMLT